MRMPLATYRIQFSPSFGFKQAEEVISYLKELGISDLYASPIFKAKKSSAHGYDVVDPNQINPELGGPQDFQKLFDSLKANGLFWMQDIVPNHMAIDSDNLMLMDVLENGKASRYFNFFDIDWDHPYENMKGRLLLPVLGGFYADCLEDGQIQLKYDEAGFSINYYAFRFPLRIDSYPQALEYNLGLLENKLTKVSPDFIKFIGVIHFLKSLASLESNNGQRYEQIRHAKKMLWNLYNESQVIKGFLEENIRLFNGERGAGESFNALDKLISEQYFRLSFWKVATEEINYRRFFTVNDLISLRAEDEEIFNKTHDLIFKLVEEGKLEGLRVDHIDGLYDPATYLDRLRKRIGDKFIVIEKVLVWNEKLPRDWPVQGTTGYDFMNYLNGLFIKKENETEFSRLYYNFTGLHSSYEKLVCDKKRLIIGKYMAGNIDNLAQAMKKISSSNRQGSDITLYGLKRALVEVFSFFPVYRTYINFENFSESDRAYIKTAIEKAKQSIPDFLYELNFIERFLLDSDSSLSQDQKKARLGFVMNFQQYTSPLMAKGFEDTVLYVYNRFISLNEVGGFANAFGIPIEKFHGFLEDKASSAPNSLLATSTHDVKRGEDVRARINVLSEIPYEWSEQLKFYSKVNKAKKKGSEYIFMPEANDEYFLYQTLIGAFPPEGQTQDFKERIKGYIIKAVREAKVHTAWIKPDNEYEKACIDFVGKILDQSEDNHFLKEFIPFQRKIAYYGIFNSLSQALIKITAPGVTDFYQGSELWDLNLVDPDNRRSVDFNKRKLYLNEIKEKSEKDLLGLINEVIADKESGKIKLFLIYRALKARQERFDTFLKGAYISLEISGALKEHIIAFARRFEDKWAITVVPRFLTSLLKEGELPLGAIWQDTQIILPKEAPASWKDAITQQQLTGDGKILIADILKHFPAGLLIFP